MNVIIHKTESKNLDIYVLYLADSNGVHSIDIVFVR